MNERDDENLFRLLADDEIAPPEGLTRRVVDRLSHRRRIIRLVRTTAIAAALLLAAIIGFQWPRRGEPQTPAPNLARLATQPVLDQADWIARGAQAAAGWVDQANESTALPEPELFWPQTRQVLDELIFLAIPVREHTEPTPKKERRQSCYKKHYS